MAPVETTAPSGMLDVASDLLGTLRVRQADVLDFPRGVLGFPECKRFVLAPTGREGIYWLHSLDHSALAFLLADPFVFFPEYAVDLTPATLAELRADSPTDLAVFTILTLPATAEEPATANLQGPVVVNLAKRRAAQIVIPESPFGVRHALKVGAVANAA
jgi:flagellar assembly factor FliW